MGGGLRSSDTEQILSFAIFSQLNTPFLTINVQHRPTLRQDEGVILRTTPAEANTNLTTTRPEGEQRPRLGTNGEDAQQTGTTRGRLIGCGCNR